MQQVFAEKILNAVILTGAGSSFRPKNKERSFFCTGLTSTGTGAATIDIEVSNDGVNFLKLGSTQSLTLGTAVTSTGFASVEPWMYVRANVKTISGTDAAVTVWLGC